jgi:glycine/D-amino acid oxidase-like deaminating enzyme
MPWRSGPHTGRDLSADVCVIGGGFTGVNTAIELASAAVGGCWKRGASAGAPAGATAAS